METGSERLSDFLRAPVHTSWIRTGIQTFKLYGKHCCCSVAKLTPWTAACQAPLCSAVSWNLLKFMSIALVILPNHLILCRPLFLLLSIFPSTSVLTNESAPRCFPHSKGLLEVQPFLGACSNAESRHLPSTADSESAF